MDWWTSHPRWTVVHSRAGIRWIVAALASFVLLGYVVWSHRTNTYPAGSGFIQNFLPFGGNKPPAAASNGGGPLIPLPAWVDTPATFELTGGAAAASAAAATAELDRPLALHPRLAPAVEAFLARPVLSHEDAVALNEVQCPRAQLDEQVNKDQLREEQAKWTSLTVEDVAGMRRAAVEFLERRAEEEGEDALLGPGFTQFGGPAGGGGGKVVKAVEEGSRGVVIAAGNKRTVERAVLCIKELQRLGWTGGVEVWHFEGEMEGEEERAPLEALGVKIHMVSTLFLFLCMFPSFSSSSSLS